MSRPAQPARDLFPLRERQPHRRLGRRPGLHLTGLAQQSLHRTSPNTPPLSPPPHASHPLVPGAGAPTAPRSSTDAPDPTPDPYGNPPQDDLTHGQSLRLVQGPLETAGSTSQSTCRMTAVPTLAVRKRSGEFAGCGLRGCRGDCRTPRDGERGGRLGIRGLWASMTYPATADPPAGVSHPGWRAPRTRVGLASQYAFVSIQSTLRGRSYRRRHWRQYGRPCGFDIARPDTFPMGALLQQRPL